MPHLFLRVTNQEIKFFKKCENAVFTREYFCPTCGTTLCGNGINERRSTYALDIDALRAE